MSRARIRNGVSAISLAMLLASGEARGGAAPANPIADDVCSSPRAALAAVLAGGDVHAANVASETPLLSRVIDCGTNPDGTFDADHRALFDALIAHGADPKRWERGNGDTPIIVAARLGNVEAIGPLAAAGAIASGSNDRGETPIGIARGATITGEKNPRVEDALLRASLWLRALRWMSVFAHVQAWATPPIWLALVITVWQWRKRPPRTPKKIVKKGDGLPRLTALLCAACGAPVPIEPRDLVCPHCQAPVKVPEDYRPTIEARARMAEDVRIAASRWRRVVAMGARRVTIPLRIAGLLWTPIVLLGFFSPFDDVWGPNGIETAGGPGVYCFVLATSVVWSAALFAYGVHLAGARAIVPPLPSTGEVGEAATETCKVCGAPVQFERAEIVACCSYCGAECYRVAIARAARVEAEGAEQAAEISIYDAMCAVDERRRASAWAVVVSGAVVIALAGGIAATIWSPV